MMSFTWPHRRGVARSVSAQINSWLPPRVILERLEDRRLFVAYFWAAAAGGAWGVAANWVPAGGPPGLGDMATIVLPGAYTVTLGADPIVAALTIGPAAGTQVLDVSSTLTIAGPLTVNASGKLRMLASAPVSNVLHAAMLAIGPGIGQVDLFNNDMIIGPVTPKAAIIAEIGASRNGGAWNGFGAITSTSARTNAQQNTTLGVLDGAEYTSVSGAHTFGGVPFAAGDTLVKYTYYGDTDFNGRINFDDYVRTDNGFNNHLAGWLHGDFDGNGTIDFDDYVLIDVAFNTQSDVL
jgi:hypothetical protein